MIFTANLIGDYQRYLDSDAQEIAQDVGYHTYPIHLNPQEMADFIKAFSAFLLPFLQLPPPEKGRQKRLLSIVMMPDGQAKSDELNPTNGET